MLTIYTLTTRWFIVDSVGIETEGFVAGIYANRYWSHLINGRNQSRDVATGNVLEA